MSFAANCKQIRLFYMTLIVLLLSVLLPQINLFCFENCADLNFFVGITLPWKLWRWMMKRGMKQYISRSYKVEYDCNSIGQVYSAQYPILFKNCIKPEFASVENFLFFEDHVQNLFPPCNGKVLRHFTFEGFNNETKAIIEDVPCANSTLREKITNFHAHKFVTNATLTQTRTHTANEDTTKPLNNEEETDAESSYFEVHTHVMSVKQKQYVNQMLSRILRIENINDMGLTTKMVMPVLTYFLHAGRSAVYYLHAHMDHFFSFCLTESKTWMLIDPYYHDDFTSLWTGNAQMMLKELKPVPKVMITQQQGDILFIPPWWIHQTMVSKKKKNLGFNIHFGSPGQISTEVADFVTKYIGNTAFFYRHAMGLDKDSFY